MQVPKDFWSSSQTRRDIWKHCQASCRQVNSLSLLIKKANKGSILFHFKTITISWKAFIKSTLQSWESSANLQYPLILIFLFSGLATQGLAGLVGRKSVRLSSCVSVCDFWPPLHTVLKPLSGLSWQSSCSRWQTVPSWVWQCFQTTTQSYCSCTLAALGFFLAI